MNRSSAQEVISAYLFNIYATELQIVLTDTTRMRDSAQLVRLFCCKIRPHDLKTKNDGRHGIPKISLSVSGQIVTYHVYRGLNFFRNFPRQIVFCFMGELLTM